MIYIYKDRIIRLEWTILKGTSNVKEDFSRALVKLFLIGPADKYLLDATAENGVVTATIPQGLPEGNYAVEVIYAKNWGNLLNSNAPVDERFNDRCLMRSRKDDLFGITNYQSEADNAGEGEVVVTLKTSVATYGYDGLSAYELAVMRSDFKGSETMFVSLINKHVTEYFADYINSIHLDWKDTAYLTRIQVIPEMRRKGLMLYYVNGDGKAITEKCVYDTDTSDYMWGLDSSWQSVEDLVLGGELYVSTRGTWTINGADTGIDATGPKGDNGITPIFRNVDNKLQYTYDGEEWIIASEPVAAWFRWNNNKIQISRDNKTWEDFSGEFADNLFIKGYVATYAELPSSAVQGDIWGVGPTYADTDTEQTNPIYRYYVKNANAWVDNGSFTSISAGVVQETGDSETAVMSQKAVTEKIEEVGAQANTNLEKDIEVWEQGSYTSTNPISLTIKDNRLRTEGFVYTKKGTRVKVKASELQWVAINQFYLDLSGAYSRDVQIFSDTTVVINQDCMLLPVIGNTDNSVLTINNRISEVTICPIFNVEDSVLEGSENIVTGNAVYNAINNENTTITFVGKGTELSETSRYGLIEGRRYRVSLPITDWLHDNTGDGITEYIFLIRSFNNQTETRLITVQRNNAVNREYEFVAPQNTEIRFGGRANVGVKVQLVIRDITDNYVFANKINATKDEVKRDFSWVNGSYTSTNPITLTNVTHRLRSNDFIRVDKGTRISVKASASQWVVVNQFYVDLSGWYSKDVQFFTDKTIIVENECLILPVIGNTDNSIISVAAKSSDVSIYPIIDLVDIYNKKNESDVEFKNIEYAFAAKKRASILNKSAANDPKNNYNQFMTIVHITDTHGDSERVDRAFQVAEKLNAIVVCSGDMVYYYNTDDYTYMKLIQDKYPNVKFLPCIGNHEAWVQQSSTDYTAIETLYNKIIEPSNNGQDWVYPSGINYPTYYYYDDTTYKIRFISLNKYMEVNRQEYMSQEQVDFFCEALESLPNDYDVIVIMHSAEGKVKEIEGYDKFLTMEYSSGYNGAGIAKIIIDAFLSRSIINTTYTFPKGSVNIVADFSGNTTNDFIGYIVGHIHYDGIGCADGVSNLQLVLCETCTNNFINLNKDSSFSLNNNNPDLNEWSDLARQDNTVNQDAFNVYVIDKENGNIRIVRIGSDLTADFKKRDYMIVPYKM